jgi:hypothetical protein
MHSDKARCWYCANASQVLFQQHGLICFDEIVGSLTKTLRYPENAEAVRIQPGRGCRPGRCSVDPCQRRCCRASKAGSHGHRTGDGVDYVLRDRVRLGCWVIGHHDV